MEVFIIRMDKKEISRVVKLMVTNSDQDKATVNVKNLDEFKGDFADKKAEVEVKNLPEDSSLNNHRWHEANNYKIEFISSTKRNNLKLLMEKENKVLLVIDY